MNSPLQGPNVPRRSGPRLGLGSAMLLMSGVAAGLGLVASDVRTRLSQDGPIMYDFIGFGTWDKILLIVAVAVLGGLSFVGLPMLLARRGRGRWGPGRLLWSAHGTAAWLLWPPIIYRKLDPGPGSLSPLCFFYGTPLMAVYMVAALTFGRWIGPRRRRDRLRRFSLRARRDWQERFGLFLGLSWASCGLYVLFHILWGDFFG